MSIVYSQITLDVLKIGAQATVNAKTGDANSRGVEITLNKGGEPYEIPKDARAIIRSTITGSTVFNYATIEGNTIKYTFTTGDVAVAGAWTMECQIIEGDEADPLSSLYSPCFKLLVENTLYSDSEVESQDQFTALTQAISQVLDALAETDNLNISASKSGDTTTVTITHKDGTESSVAIRDGEQGAQGDPGKAATLSLGTVTTETLTPTSPATVEITEGGTAQDRTLSFAFGVPKGDKGDTGEQGASGSAAEITSVSADATTLDPDEAATASVATGGTAQARSFSFSFGIPKGDKGDTGAAGQNGQNGAAAGFGTISATATAGESASASVETSGPDTAKNMEFSFVIPPVVDGGITTAKLADGAVTDAKIESVSAGKIVRAIPINGLSGGSTGTPNRILYESLPSDCFPVSYLESTGTQYIDTGVQPVFDRSSAANSKTTTFVMVSGFDSDKQTSQANDNYFFGAADTAFNGSSSVPTTNGINLFRNTTTNGIRSIYNNQLTEYANQFVGKVQSRPAVLGPATNAFLYNYADQVYVNSTGGIGNFTQTGNIYLFGLHLTGSGQTDQLAKGCRIMFCQIGLATYDSAWVETPVRQFFPVLDPNGIPAMFDTISQTYFYNAGSGQFLWG